MATPNMMPNFGDTSGAKPIWTPQVGGGGMGGGGSNQWMQNYPTLPSNPYNYNYGNQPTGGYFAGMPGGKSDMGGNVFTAPTFSPSFTGDYYSLLSSLLNPSQGLQGDFLSFLSGGQSSIPGASQLGQMAQTGDPFNASPEWQAMIAAQQQNIQQNQANLKEQFGFAGDLSSSPFGTAMSNYEQQTTLDQNALLAQLMQSSFESAQQRKLQAGSEITGLAGNASQFFDSLFGSGATASPGLFSKNKGSVLGGIGSLLGAAGSLGGMSTGGGGTLAGDVLGFLGL